MKKLKTILKIITIVFFVSSITSCISNDDPYASYTAEREAGLISDWLTSMVSSGKDLDTTSTGIFYVVDKVGSGPTVQAGDTVTVKYVGYYMDGGILDASAYHSTDSTYTYVHKTDRMIQGWEEGIEVLNKGESAVFLFPSEKAYGSSAYYSIPPYSAFIFYIEVLDIK